MQTTLTEHQPDNANVLTKATINQSLQTLLNANALPSSLTIQLRPTTQIASAAETLLKTIKVKAVRITQITQITLITILTMVLSKQHAETPHVLALM